MPTANYFDSAGFLGTAKFEDEFQATRSLAYFCAECGEIWFRIPVTLNSGRAATWFAEHVPCLRCKPSSVLDWSRIPGTITDSFSVKQSQLSRMWWGKALEHLPPPVLRREFHTLLNYFSKEFS